MKIGAYPSNGSRRVSSAGRSDARRVDDGDAVRIVEDDATKQTVGRRRNPPGRRRLRRGSALPHPRRIALDTPSALRLDPLASGKRRGRAHYSDRLLILKINGTKKAVDANPGEILLDVLRREGYKGAKFGCGQGFCGACTVLLDGRPVNSCLLLVGLVEGREITTIEGVGSVDDLHPIQEAYLDAGAVQCGYCSPGFILATKALLDEKPDPTEAQIKGALDGNYCRCTGYVKIVEAVKLAGKRLRKKVRK